MDYTICKKFVESSMEPSEKTCLLFHFVQNNEDRVICNARILEDYNSFNSNVLFEWIKLMDISNSWKIIENVECNSIELYIESCKKSMNKTIIVNEYEDYDQVLYEELIDVLDSFTALKRFSQNLTIQNTIVNGNDASVTLGSSSPVTNS